MEDARETRGLNLKLCFEVSAAMADEVGPGPLSVQSRLGGRGASRQPGRRMTQDGTGRAGPVRAHGNPDRPLHPARPHTRPTGSTGGDRVRR